MISFIIFLGSLFSVVFLSLYGIIDFLRITYHIITCAEISNIIHDVPTCIFWILIYIASLFTYICCLNNMIKYDTYSRHIQRIRHMARENFTTENRLQINLRNNPLIPVKKKDIPAEDCSICLDGLRKNKSTRGVIKLYCQHYFHHGCIYEWFDIGNRCPLCRNENLMVT